MRHSGWLVGDWEVGFWFARDPLAGVTLLSSPELSGVAA